MTTKERLVRAAAPIFAENGFRDTTVAEICEAAKANIAAVNYHFGDKTKLYMEVWEFLFKASVAHCPVPTTFAEIGPEEWLIQFLRSKIRLTTSEELAGLYPKLLHREMTGKTTQHKYIIDTFLFPERENVRTAISAFFDDEITDDQLNLCTLNFMGIHITMNVNRQRNAMHNSPRCPTAFDSEALVSQAVDFAIGGLKSVKKGLK